MQTRSFLRHTMLASAAALTFCGVMPAQATQFLTGGYVDNPALNFSVSSISPAASYGGGAGGFSGIWDPTGANLAIDYWCFDLQHEFSPGNTYNYTASILNNDALSRLFHEAGGSGGALATNITSAAFQLAIWEIEYDSDDNLATGNFKVVIPGGGDALTAYNLAQTWLGGLGSSVADYTIILLSSNENPQTQNFITDTKIPSNELLPEPSSLPLLGLGLAAMVFVGSRRRAGTRTGQY